MAGGRSYANCGVADNGVNYPLDQPTYYQALRTAGYQVAGVGKFDLHKASLDWGLDGSRLLADWGFTAGIDNEGKLDGSRSYQQSGGPQGPYLAYLHERDLAESYCQEHAQRRQYQDAYTTALPDEAYCDNWLAENGLDFLRNFPADQPWHLVINFVGPHNPMDVTASMRRAWEEVAFPPPHHNHQADYSPQDQQRNRQNYAAMIENIDRQVGRFIDLVRRRGELDNTLIVYASDHGEMLGDHSRWGKSTWQQSAIGVPLIIAGPGVQSGQASEALVSLHDLAATFIDYAGADPWPEMEARSLRPLLAGGTNTHRDHIISALHDWQAILDGRYKLIHQVDSPPRLFDLQADPLEETNIAPQHPEIVNRLQQLSLW